MKNVSFIAKKSSGADKPYAVFTGTMFGGPATYKVLRKYKNDDSAEYAVWFMVVVTPATGEIGDMGDTYVKDVVTNFDLSKVDGRDPTVKEFAEIAALRSVFVSDGTSEVFTMNEIMAGAKPTN
jgi:hypothetical protein